jgi:glycosyltransferase involved in cell wall biosynthesis
MFAQSKGSAPISVVITTFNDGELLKQSLQSVLSQTLQPTELFIIDDGSSSDSARNIVSAAREQAKFKVDYIWQENGGPSAARNAGLKHVTQDYVAYLDADDYWLPSHLQTLFGLLGGKSLEYSTSYSGFIEFDHCTNKNKKTIKIGVHDCSITEKFLGLPDGIPAGMEFQLHRVQALRDIGGFDEALRVNEDFDLLLRLGKRKYKILGKGKPTVMRRVHLNSATRSDPTNTIAELEKFLLKASRDRLLQQNTIASKRKWVRLTAAKHLLGHPDSTSKALGLIREAFTFHAPTDLKQRFLKFLVSSDIGGKVAGYIFRLCSRWPRRR